MYWTKSLMENKTVDFEIQTSYQMTIRKPDQVLIKKKKRIWQFVDVVVPADYSKT